MSRLPPSKHAVHAHSASPQSTPRKTNPYAITQVTLTEKSRRDGKHSTVVQCRCTLAAAASGVRMELFRSSILIDKHHTDGNSKK